MVEIYNEELRDLLAPVNGKQRRQQSLQIKVTADLPLLQMLMPQQIVVALPCPAGNCILSHPKQSCWTVRGKSVMNVGLKSMLIHEMISMKLMKTARCTLPFLNVVCKACSKLQVGVVFKHDSYASYTIYNKYIWFCLLCFQFSCHHLIDTYISSKTAINDRALQEDSMLGVRVDGACEELVSDPARMKLLFQKGNSRRQTSSHRMNAVSSRSHAIFQIMIERRSSDSSASHVSTLNFVDLAGSERIEKSGNDYEALRTREANNINVSLLMLGNVISKLAERSVRSMQTSNRAGSPGRAAQSSPDHVPYRNSKLTRLLQPSLGGNARTAIIATINPSADQVEETLHTLRSGCSPCNCCLYTALWLQGWQRTHPWHMPMLV